MLVFTCSYGSPNTRLQPGHPVPAKRMQNMKRREGTNYRHVNTNKRKRLLSFLPPFAILTYYLVIHATVVLFFFSWHNRSEHQLLRPIINFLWMEAYMTITKLRTRAWLSRRNARWIRFISPTPIDDTFSATSKHTLTYILSFCPLLSHPGTNWIHTYTDIISLSLALFLSFSQTYSSI